MATTTRLIPSAYDGVRARPGTSNVRARFEVEIERGALGLVAGLLDGQDLGMLHAVVGVGSTPHDLAFWRHQHRAYAWIRRNQSDATMGEPQGLLHEARVARFG